MKAYPDNIKEISFLASLDHSAPFPPWFAALGALGYWVIGQFGTRHPGAQRREDRSEEPVIDTTSVRAGSSTATPTWSTTTRDSCSRSSAPRSRPARRRRTTSSWSAAERAGDRWVASCATSTPARSSRTATTIVNAAGPFVDELNQQWGVGPTTASCTRRASIWSCPGSRRGHQRVLAFFDDTQRLFYVIPMGIAR